MKKLNLVVMFLGVAAAVPLAAWAEEAETPAEQVVPLLVGADRPADPAVALNASPLIDALDSPVKQVRYHAAAAVAKFGSRVQFRNADKVIPLLCQALSERGARVALVAAPDVQVVNLVRSSLAQKGYIVDAATDVVRAANLALSAPTKDVLIIDASMTATIKILLRDFRTASQPLILIAEEGQERDVKDALKGRLTGVLSKPVDEPTIAGALDTLLAAVPPPPAKTLAARFNLLAAEALASIDVRTTAYPIAEATPSLINALELPDDVRLPVMRCLGNIGAADAVVALTLVARSAGQTEPARLGAIDAIDRISRKAGAMDPKAKELLDQLLLDQSTAVRHAAAVALGANDPSDSALKRLLADPKDVPGAPFGE